MAFKFGDKEMYLILFSHSVVDQFTPSGKAWQECAQQIEKSHSHTNSAVSRQVYVQALLFQHL